MEKPLPLKQAITQAIPISELQAAICDYARRLEAQRRKVLQTDRVKAQVREIIRAAGGQPNALGSM